MIFYDSNKIYINIISFDLMQEQEAKYIPQNQIDSIDPLPVDKRSKTDFCCTIANSIFVILLFIILLFTFKLCTHPIMKRTSGKSHTQMILTAKYVGMMMKNTPISTSPHQLIS